MIRVLRSLRRPGSPPLCSVCDGRRSQEPIILCADCIDPGMVRSYCASCKARLDLSTREAQALFRRFDLSIMHGGVTFLFPDGCARCQMDGGSEPEVYVLDESELPYDRVA